MSFRVPLLLGTALFLGACIRQASPASSKEHEPTKAPSIPCDEVLDAPPPDGGVLDALDAGAENAGGLLSKEEIRGVVRSHQQEIRGCYGSALNQMPNLEGQVAVRFVISRTGDVCAARISRSTVNHRELEDCIVRHLTSWRFPPPKDGGRVVVTYPFIFRLTDSEDAGASSAGGNTPEKLWPKRPE